MALRRRCAGASRLRYVRAPHELDPIGHGGYAKDVPVITSGPMKESRDQVEEFHDGFISDLGPGDSPSLVELARDAAAAMWRHLRVTRWEACAYSSEELLGGGLADASWLEILASNDRSAADTIRRLGAQDLVLAELWNCLACVGFHPAVLGDDAWTKLPERAGSQQVLSALLQLLGTHFESHDNAALLMEGRAAERETSAMGLRQIEMPVAVRRHWPHAATYSCQQRHRT